MKGVVERGEAARIRGASDRDVWLPTREVLAIAIATVVGASTACLRAPHRAVTLEASDVVARNAACERCHAQIAREWRGSLHRQAHADPVYQRAFALEPLPFCTACHAPEASAEEPGPSSAHALGVGCVTCHTVAASHGEPNAAPSRTQDCASCHEFAFPGSAEMMQLTVTEHRASRSADVACATCHMASVAAGGRSHRSHRFDASRNPEVVRSAARVTVTRAGRTVTFTFSPRRVGHALPTGDLFRRLRLVVELEGRRVESFLGRKTKRAVDLATANASDDRPFLRGGPAVVDLDIGDAARPIRWRVLYERVEHPMTLDEREALIDGAIEVAAGTFD